MCLHSTSLRALDRVLGRMCRPAATSATSRCWTGSARTPARTWTRPATLWRCAARGRLCARSSCAVRARGAAARPGRAQAALQAGRGVESLDLSALTGALPFPGPPELTAGRGLKARAPGRAGARPGGARRPEHHRSARGRPRPRPRTPLLTGTAPERRACRRSGGAGGAPHPSRHRARHLQDAQHAAARAARGAPRPQAGDPSR
jgi:hypothetical protein